MADGEPEASRRAVIKDIDREAVEADDFGEALDDAGDVVERVEQGVEVAAVLDEAIRAGATVRQLVGVAHADQVGGDAAASWLQVRQHVAPEVR